MNVFAYRLGTQDEETIAEIIDGNEYGLPEQFGGDEVVLDLGANIGCFACACLERGARYVECYEAEEQNCTILKRNTAYYGERVSCYRRAVWRSDERPGAVKMATDPGCTAAHHCFGDSGPDVPTLGLDRILDNFTYVDLLKIDIEGSEYPVLFTSALLPAKVVKIVGEIHCSFKFDDAPWDCTPDGLVKYLQRQGFDVETREHPKCNKLVLFTAVNRVLAGVQV